MISEDRSEAILRYALSECEADASDVYLQAQDLSLTRFAANSIHQNVSHSNAQLHIWAVAGRRVGRATTNDLTNQGVARAARQAHQNALLMPEDPDFYGLPQASSPNRMAAYDPATASSSAEERAQTVATVCTKARSRGVDAFGAYRTGTQVVAVMSTLGTRAFHRGSFAGLIITATSGSSSAWSKGGSWRAADIDTDSLADKAVDKALRGRHPQTIEPADYPVVLEHYAVDDLLSALSLYGMGAQAVQERRSWMNGLVGTQAMSPIVSVWDDGADPEGWPVPFDTEGVPRQRTAIVDRGLIREPVHSSYTAAKEGKTSTGHQAYFTGGPIATNLFMGHGTSSIDDMTASISRGIYITRFHYTRLVHSKGCVMTGMTRDGTFLIENGRLSHPVKDLRFTQSYVEALAGVEAADLKTTLVLNEVGFATKVPALKLKSFHFTGVTV